MSRGPSCRSGGEALRAARSASGAVSGAVVAGYRLADMTADELVRRLDGDAAALIIASPAHLALVEEPAARKLAAPFSRAALQEALDGLFAPHPRPAPQRTPEETARIQRAKELLIARGLTEPQAHGAVAAAQYAQTAAAWRKPPKKSSSPTTSTRESNPRGAAPDAPRKAFLRKSSPRRFAQSSARKQSARAAPDAPRKAFLRESSPRRFAQSSARKQSARAVPESPQKTFLQ